MGDYTQLHLQVEFKANTPEVVLQIIDNLVIKAAFDFNYVSQMEELVRTQRHPFFKTPRWQMILSCDSAYFVGNTFSELAKEEWEVNYVLTSLSNLKNYNDEIRLFLDWINPYIDAPAGTWIGFYRTEFDQVPHDIFKQGDD